MTPGPSHLTLQVVITDEELMNTRLQDAFVRPNACFVTR